MIYIAFLRAINVGGRYVKMERLRELVAELGVAKVETFIASGNVIVEAEGRDAAELEAQIAAKLKEGLGFTVDTFVRTPAELSAIAAHQPFPAEEAEAGTLHVGFLQADPTEEARQRFLALASDYDALHIHGRELYWLAGGRSSDSKLSNTHLERALKLPTTLRNITTVRKLAAKYSGT